MAAAQRLQLYLARAGVASRRAAANLIQAGRVTVNGVKVTEAATRIGDRDTVRVDGSIVAPEQLVTLALHKPRGYVTTMADPQGRPTVTDLLPATGYRLYPVGRLDANSEGLLLLTNDGDLCHVLTHPRHGIAKTYRVYCDREPVRAQLEGLARGVRLADGPTAPAEVRLLGERWLEIVIREGRNRQVRRMCAAVGLGAVRLVRVAIGQLRLGDLRPGDTRPLSHTEIESLRMAGQGPGGNVPGGPTASSGAAWPTVCLSPGARGAD